MKRPNVRIDNYKEVYDFYRTHQQNKVGARLGYAALSRIFHPRVQYEQGAKEQLEELVANDTSLIIATNHLTYKDQYPAAATAWQTPLREKIGRTRVLGKDELFRGAKRPFIDMMGTVPVFRSKNYDATLTREAGNYMTDAMAERLANGDNIAILPEGTCNIEHPEKLLPLRTGIGHMACRAAALETNLAIVTMGISYGENLRGTHDTDVKNALVYINQPIVNIPTNPSDIVGAAQVSLQDAVDNANRLY
jgi:1-acyl-sn-glycerol-3-phosphate acyltransferase